MIGLSNGSRRPYRPKRKTHHVADNKSTTPFDDDIRAPEVTDTGAKGSRNIKLKDASANFVVVARNCKKDFFTELQHQKIPKRCAMRQ